jgi:hypothetical protein
VYDYAIGGIAVPPGDQNAGWSDGMRTRRSNNSVVVVVFIVIVIAALLAHRTRQVTGRNAPEATSQPSSQTAAVEPRIGPPDIYPDPVRTPGATNPDITPDNIHENICNPNWSTKSIRPPVNYTNRLKTEQIQEYADADTNPRDYEEDHLIPLELGGNPKDPRNLWPEPYDTSIPDGGARYKDKVENYLHNQVCVGNLTLDQAQKEIVNDWYRVYSTSVRHEGSDR